METNVGVGLRSLPQPEKGPYNGVGEIQGACRWTNVAVGGYIAGVAQITVAGPDFASVIG